MQLPLPRRPQPSKRQSGVHKADGKDDKTDPNEVLLVVREGRQMFVSGGEGGL